MVISYKQIFKYISFFALLLILSLADRVVLGVFALGMFSALVYSKFNLIALAPAYLLAIYLTTFSLGDVLLGIVPIVVYLVAYWVHSLVHRPVRARHMTIYAILSILPRVVLEVLAGGEWYIAPLKVLVCSVYVYACILSVYALLVRGIRYRFSRDEATSMLVVLASIIAGVYGIDIYGYRPIFSVISIITLLGAHVLGVGIANVLGVAIGLGVVIGGGPASMVAVTSLMALATSLVIKKSPLLAVLALIAVDLVGAYLFEVYDIGYMHLISSGVGCIVYLALGKRKRASLSMDFEAVRDKYGTRIMVNRNRHDISSRLYEVGRIFYEMENLIKSEIKGMPTEKEAADVLTARVVGEYCKGCGEMARCGRMLSGGADSVLRDVVLAGVRNGRVGLLDLPAYITGSCQRANSLISVVNNAIRNFGEKLDDKRKFDLSKIMLADQFNGVGRLMDSMAEDIAGSINFDSVMERRIIDELSYVGIVCTEAVVYASEGAPKVSVVVRERDASEKSLISTVSKVVGVKMVAESTKCPVAGYSALTLSLAPRYELVYGEAGVSRGDEVSGDTHSLLRLRDNRVIMALCDGMGSGTVANEESNATISMIEGFYRAGFPHDTVISMLNKLLSSRDEEIFSSLDMCVINPSSGACDMIKLGSSASYIKHKNRVEVIEGAGLPVGIVEECDTACATRRVLESGDVLLMMSDGVEDVLGVAQVREYLEKCDILNPPLIADELISIAKSKSNADDMTVLCMRVIQKVA